MDIYLLGITAIFTLVLNSLLTLYLVKDKMNAYTYIENKNEIINFVLTPSIHNEYAVETEILSTEIISKGDYWNGGGLQ